MYAFRMTQEYSFISAEPLPLDEGRRLISELIAQMDQRAEEAEHYGGLWGRIRLVTALSLIVLSAIVAAEKTITSFFNAGSLKLGVAISLCSIAVAIGTAFDQSMKPGIKWRLSSGYATRFRNLKIKAQMADPTNRATISQLGDQFQLLNQGWLDDTTV